MSDFQPAAADQKLLSQSELTVLHSKILPTARRWVETYPEKTCLHEHGKSTLQYWGEVTQ